MSSIMKKQLSPVIYTRGVEHGLYKKMAESNG
jgi:hypothetical protein